MRVPQRWFNSYEDRGINDEAKVKEFKKHKSSNGHIGTIHPLVI